LRVHRDSIADFSPKSYQAYGRIQAAASGLLGAFDQKSDQIS
jgi:hypothetical protein